MFAPPFLATTHYHDSVDIYIYIYTYISGKLHGVTSQKTALFKVTQSLTLCPVLSFSGLLICCNLKTQDPFTYKSSRYKSESSLWLHYAIDSVLLRIYGSFLLALTFWAFFQLQCHFNKRLNLPVTFWAHKWSFGCIPFTEWARDLYLCRGDKDRYANWWNVTHCYCQKNRNGEKDTPKMQSKRKAVV
jgi:hypothetical protein